MLFKAKSTLSREETNSLAGRAGADLGDGWVQGHYVDGYITGEVIEANNEYIALGWWIPVDKKSVTPINDKLEEEIQILKNSLNAQKTNNKELTKTLRRYENVDIDE